MGKAFTCPHCGAHDYAILLTGCTLKGATLEEEFTWDPASGEYASSGAVLVDSEALESQGVRAICSNCEKDVSQAVSAYEAGSNEVAQA